MTPHGDRGLTAQRSCFGSTALPYVDPYRTTRTFSYPLRLNRRQRRAFDARLEGERLLYNGAHEHRVKAYRWACGLASILGLARPRKVDLEAIDLATLDPRRAAVWRQLMDWKSPNFDHQKDALALVSQRRELGEVVVDAPNVVTRWTLAKLDLAWQAFFKRVAEGKTPGFPRFKSMARWRTFGCHELDDGSLARPNHDAAAEPGERRFGHDATFAVNSRMVGYLKVPGIDGAVVVRMHRTLPEGAVLRACSFTRDGGRWTVNLQVRVKIAHPAWEVDASTITADEVFAVDVGRRHQATDNHGRTYPNVRAGRKRQPEVRRMQRALGRAKKGSANRERRKRELAAERRRERNERALGMHRNTSAVVRAAIWCGARAIGREDLDLLNLLRSARGTAEEPGVDVAWKASQNRDLADSGLGRFCRELDAKAERAGLPCVAVDPRWTTVRCRDCPALVPKALSERIHRCPRCGLVMDRDHMAAGNVAAKAALALRDPEGLLAHRVASEWRKAVRAAKRERAAEARDAEREARRLARQEAKATANAARPLSSKERRRRETPGAVVRPGAPTSATPALGRDRVGLQ